MYVRDKLIALGMRRPILVSDEDFDTPMLEIGDFDIHPFSDDATQTAGGFVCELLMNTEAQHALAVMFIQETKLCHCVGLVLKTQYCISNHAIVDSTSEGITTQASITLIPKDFAQMTISAIRKCERELETWCAHLPSEARNHPPKEESGASPENPTLPKILYFHRALLRLIYLATTSALHRPQALNQQQANLSSFSSADSPTSSSAPSENIPPLRDPSRTKVRKAAIEITEIAQNLQERDLVRYLPMAGVTVLLPAIIIHLLAVKNADNNVREVNLQRFYQCMNILQEMRDIYAPADFAAVFLKKAIKKAGIEAPSRMPPLRVPISPVSVNGMAVSESSATSRETTDELISPITPEYNLQQYGDWCHSTPPDSSLSSEELIEPPLFRFPGFNGENTSGFYSLDSVGSNEYSWDPISPNTSNIKTSFYTTSPAMMSFPAASDKIATGVRDPTHQQNKNFITDDAPSNAPRISFASFELPYHGTIPKRCSLEPSEYVDANSTLTDCSVGGSYDSKPDSSEGSSSTSGFSMPAISAVPSLSSFGLKSVSPIRGDAGLDVSIVRAFFSSSYFPISPEINADEQNIQQDINENVTGPSGTSNFGEADFPGYKNAPNEDVMGEMSYEKGNSNKPNSIVQSDMEALIDFGNSSTDNLQVNVKTDGHNE